MATLNLIDTKLVLKFSDQSYANSNINDASTDETIYAFAIMMEKYQLTAPQEIIKSLKYQFITG